MRIVYDDYMQNSFIDCLNDFMTGFNPIAIVKYDYGMNRVMSYKLKNVLNDYLCEKGFEIGKADYHEYGIGNNNRHPVYYVADNELQHCANININSGLFSEVYVNVEDYKGTLVSHRYEVTPRGVKVFRR